MTLTVDEERKFLAAGAIDAAFIESPGWRVSKANIAAIGKEADFGVGPAMQRLKENGWFEEDGDYWLGTQKLRNYVAKHYLVGRTVKKAYPKVYEEVRPR